MENFDKLLVFITEKKPENYLRLKSDQLLLEISLVPKYTVRV